ncbi:DUF3047 domain-containing protein [Ramlibacter sp. G-1-2-2]|uniref:DUF3047 domain-containing protein n=2 Tax=Ramlibacter agri TaxID=2728837 RepID=A0A848H2E4_9BURK|nr:DUF3047 domain-containing protein [Ramlibacter agri]
MPALLALGLAGCASAPQAQSEAAVSQFSTCQQVDCLPPGWEPYVLRRDLPRTDYRMVDFEGQRVLHASGVGASSGLRCAVQADAHATPWLRWGWRADDVPAGACVSRSETDDSPARVVLAFDGDLAELSPRDRTFFELVELVTGQRLPYATLMYVWDAQLPIGSVVHYARTSRIRYLVVESGTDRQGRWTTYERNVQADFRRAFGEEPGAIQSVGVLSDSDDLKQDIRAWYGDVVLGA